MKRWSVVCLLALVAALPAAASTFLAMSRGELIDGSAAVVQGEVLEVRSFWDAEGRVIVSEALIQVEEAVLGDPGSQVRVKTWGGTVDGYTVEAHGFPKFSAHDRVLLFLEREHEGVAKVAGYQQGHYRLVVDRSGFEWAVPTVDAGANLLTADGRPAPAAKAMLLDELKGSIRDQARHAGRLEY